MNDTYTFAVQQYRTALTSAITMMEQAHQLEPTSAFKQAASDEGIEYGKEMESFVSWARGVLFGDPIKMQVGAVSRLVKVVYKHRLYYVDETCSISNRVNLMPMTKGCNIWVDSDKFVEVVK